MVMGGAGSMVAMDPRMKSMQDMHKKMLDANSPAQRQALMADHMKAMQGGMAMRRPSAVHPPTGLLRSMLKMDSAGVRI